MNDDVLIVSFCLTSDSDISTLVVGRRTDNGIDIINYFNREEADRIYEILTRKKQT